MRKILFVSCCIVMCCSLSSCWLNKIDTNSNDEVEYVGDWEIGETGFSFSDAMSGAIGGDHGTMTMRNNEGVVSLPSGDRYVYFNSYDRETRKLILDSYTTAARYIGQYVGIYTGKSYKGRFENVNGASVPFNIRTY